jgi:2-amino-4-hydroxy-6-hydroxymethyldihydropteridine diphosphokinase
MSSPPHSHLAFVALGSNLGDARQNVLRALQRLQSLSDAPLRRSSLWETAPVDCPPGSPPFINAVAGLEPRASETPRTLLAQLQALEKDLGRQPKKIPNEPRLIDLDLIAFGSQTVTPQSLVVGTPREPAKRAAQQFVPISGVRSAQRADPTLPGPPKTDRLSQTNVAPDLVLPHPRAHLRRFVLQPLSEIAPDYILPGQRKTVAKLLKELHSKERLRPMPDLQAKRISL